MSNVKGLFASPKKAAVTLICAGVILVMLGICIVVYAAGGTDQGSALPSAVTLVEARDIALADAGLTRGQAVFTEAEPDEEDGLSVYEFKFRAGGAEYAYEINAQTGAVYSKSVVIYEREPAEPSAPAQTAAPAEGPVPDESAAPSAQAGPPAASAPVSTPQLAQQPAEQTCIGLDAAKSAALSDAGVDASQVTFTKAQMDYEDGVMVYEVEFCTATHEHEYEIDAATGAICSHSVEACSHSGRHHSDRHHGEPQSSGAVLLGTDAAKRAALTHAGLSADEVTFTKTELDYEDGRAVYEIEFRKGGAEYEYEIDAVTGAVLEYEWELD